MLVTSGGAIRAAIASSQCAPMGEPGATERAPPEPGGSHDAAGRLEVGPRPAAARRAAGLPPMVMRQSCRCWS
jgi:hypothetical protein